MKRLSLIMKPFVFDDPNSEEIYANTRKSCELLNAYLLDFIETVCILEERKSESGRPADGRKPEDMEEIEDSIEFVRGSIREISDSMRKIAGDWPFLVDLKEE